MLCKAATDIFRITTPRPPAFYSVAAVAALSDFGLTEIAFDAEPMPSLLS